MKIGRKTIKCVPFGKYKQTNRKADRKVNK